MQAKINNAKEGDILELPYFYYPGYEMNIEMQRQKKRESKTVRRNQT